MSIYISSDNRGISLKNYLIAKLEKNNNVIKSDLVNYDTDDYPDFAFDVCNHMSKEEDTAILICGNGIGISIAANKVKGIRCARVVSTDDSYAAKTHNHANAISLAADLEPTQALEIVNAFLHATPSIEDRHVRRVNKIISYENGEYNEV